MPSHSRPIAAPKVLLLFELLGCHPSHMPCLLCLLCWLACPGAARPHRCSPSWLWLLLHMQRLRLRVCCLLGMLLRLHCLWRLGCRLLGRRRRLHWLWPCLRLRWLLLLLLLIVRLLWLWLHLWLLCLLLSW